MESIIAKHIKIKKSIFKLVSMAESYQVETPKIGVYTSRLNHNIAMTTWVRDQHL